LIEFRVFGQPAPQGSKTIMRGRLVEANKKLPAWRKAVQEAAEQVEFYSEEPLEVLITFYLPRPKTVKRKHPAVKPDIDKLIRGTLDPLTQAGVIKDDALVVEVSARKEYCEPGQEGAWIQIVETL